MSNVEPWLIHPISFIGPVKTSLTGGVVCINPDVKVLRLLAVNT